MWGFVNLLFWIFYKLDFIHMKLILVKNCLCCIDFRYCHDRMRACGSRETVVRPLILTYNTNIKSKIHYHDFVNAAWPIIITNITLMSGLQENGPWEMTRFQDKPRAVSANLKKCGKSRTLLRKLRDFANLCAGFSVWTKRRYFDKGIIFPDFIDMCINTCLWSVSNYPICSCSPYF